MGTMSNETTEGGGVPEHSLMRWFDGSHLRSPELRGLVEGYRGVAKVLDYQLPGSAEKTVALRKLLESKDAAVRAAIEAGAG